MLNPIQDNDLRPHSRRSGTPGFPIGGRYEERKEEIHSISELQLRRLRYFVDLLAAGYRQVQSPEPLSPSLRGERIAIGIDLPELDTVPLWSARRGDGTVSIPFIEFLVGQIGQILDGLCGERADAPTPEEERLLARRRALKRFLEDSGLVADGIPLLPRLNDTFLPEEMVRQLCGAGGLLEEIGQQIDSILTREAIAHEH
jgi:hypothetical protein